MELVLLSLGTGVLSFGMKLANELRMYKDVADAGYKVNMNKLSDLGKLVNPDASRMVWLSMIIPFLNMMLVIKRTIDYNNTRNSLLSQLKILDVLEEMNEEEFSEYLAKPTGLNAIIISIKTKLKLSTAIVISFDRDDAKGNIYVDFDKKTKKFSILKKTGTLKNLSKEELDKLLKETLNNFFESLPKDLDNSIVEKEKNHFVIELSKNEENNAVKTKSIKEQKEELEDFKEEILEEQLLNNKDEKQMVKVRKKNENNNQ